MQVGVGNDVGVGQGKDAAVAVEVAAVVHAALPLPLVAGIETGIVAETLERGAAQALEVELARPLVFDLAQCVGAASGSMGT